MIEKRISSTFINGFEFQRKVVFEGIQYLQVSNKHAEIVWKVYLLDSDNNPIIHPDVEIGRLVTSPISNSNKVDSNGIMITKELTIVLNPILKDETEEEYQNRIELILSKSLETGIPEFDFYFEVLMKYPLSVILIQAAEQLDYLKRFDRLD